MRVYLDDHDLDSTLATRGQCANTFEPDLARWADCFATGDIALFKLDAIAGIPILSPRQFLEKYHLGR